MSTLTEALARFVGAKVKPVDAAMSAYDPTVPRDASAVASLMRSKPSQSYAALVAREKKRYAAIYAGATADRLTGDFIYALRSPDMELRTELRTLRSRARQLAHDNANVRKFLYELGANVIGPKGHRLLAKHQTTDSPPLPHARANKAIEAAWKDFGRKDNAIASKDMTLDQTAVMVVQNLAIDGEVFIHRIKGFDNDHGYTLDTIDPDQFDETYFRYAFTDNQTEVRMGIEIDRWGKPIAYWPWKRHPSEYAQQIRIRIPASEILHIFVRRRPRQTRGETWLAPVMRDLKMYDGYQYAELAGSRFGASKGGFFETDPTKGGQYATPSDPDAAEDLLNRGIMMSGEPASYEELPPGVTFKPIDWQHPTAQYEAFSRQILMSAAAGMGASYASFTGDMSRANYSSMREGKQSERKGYEIVQEFIDAHFYEPIYRDWLPMAILSGALKLPTVDASRWNDIQFIAPGQEYVEPFKDAQANSLMVAMGLTSRRRLCAERGDVFEEILAEQAEELQMQKDYGVILSLDTRLTATPGAGGTADTNVKPGEEDAPPAGEESSGGGGDGGDGGRMLAIVGGPQRRLNA